MAGSACLEAVCLQFSDCLSELYGRELVSFGESPVFLKERPRSGMEIVLVGLNHRTAPVEVRERVSFTADQARRASEELRAKGILEETLVLSTCNRSEVYGVPPETSRECPACRPSPR